ncbi:MAG: DUF3501 family protein [Bacteroidetes bacterium]|nr:DUF3501 family protein [Bacteroidota bacterium]
MVKINLSDILDIAAYELNREEFQKSVFPEKKSRRIHLGDNMTLLLENRLTMLYQIQEMCRTERIVKPDAIQHEINTYSKLASDKSALRATILIEYPTSQTRDEMLKKLLGLHEHLFLEFVHEENVHRILAKFDMEQIGHDRLSSVQYIEFPLTGLNEAFLLSDKMSFLVDHPEYNAQAILAVPQMEALKQDARG